MVNEGSQGLSEIASRSLSVLLLRPDPPLEVSRERQLMKSVTVMSWSLGDALIELHQFLH
jgi:hypothetical protein